LSNPTTASAGNPALRPELTDSYEAKLAGRLSGQEIDLTGFLRHTTNVLSNLADLGENGVLVTRPVNLGTRTLRGASLSMRGSLGGGFNYTLAANLADQSFSLGESDTPLTRIGAEYGASARLEYRDGVEGRRGTDRFTFSARYRGPTYGGYYRISAFAGGDASWSHAFTDRLSSVLAIADVFGPPRIRTTSYSGTTFSRDVSRIGGPRITFSLTYSLSRPSQH
jgi:outer membrane receptor protein involved in Fe transport